MRGAEQVGPAGRRAIEPLVITEPRHVRAAAVVDTSEAVAAQQVQECVRACVENKPGMAGQNTPVGRPSLAEARGQPEIDLALAGRAGRRMGRSLRAAVSCTHGRAYVEDKESA